MLGRLLRSLALGLALTVATVASAHARLTAIGTFGFTQAYQFGQAPFATLDGTFTGVIDPTREMSLSDLLSFEARLFVNLNSPLLIELYVERPTLFSYTPGSNSTLSYVVKSTTAELGCVGAAAAFLSACRDRPLAIGTPTAITGSAITTYAGYLLVSTSFPTVTLLSQTVVPEPDTAVFLLAGVGLLIGWRRYMGAR